MASKQRPSAAGTSDGGGGASPGTKVAGVLFAAWCLGFAAVNVWQLAAGRIFVDDLRGYGAVLVVEIALVLLLKLVGAGVALASLRPIHHPRVGWLVATALWGATSTLALYSAGSVVITVGTLGGWLEPSAAWQAAGGVTLRSIAYVLFFLLGSVTAAVLAVSFHRRERPSWTVLAAGVAVAPALLGGLLVGLPALLAPAG